MVQQQKNDIGSIQDGQISVFNFYEKNGCLAGISDAFCQYSFNVRCLKGIYTAKEKEWCDGYATSIVNIRSQPSTESKILGTLDFNDKISFQSLDNTQNWIVIEYNGNDAYVCSDYISYWTCPYQEYEVPVGSRFKSYMSYKTILSKSSKQYKLQDEYAYTGRYGIRQSNNRYCVAIGTYFGCDIGDYADLVLENGEIIHIIVSDVKDDMHTDTYNIATKKNGCVSEFIVDTDFLAESAKLAGDISCCNEKWRSKVVKIKVYDKNIFQ